MKISKKDVIWNYLATFLKIASSVLLLPFILKMMPSEEVAIWSVFMTISAFAAVLDFGFNPSFTRNVTYVFSGVRALKREGHGVVTEYNGDIDYGLLKGLISTMKWFYFRMAVLLFLLMSTVGTVYITSILNKYHGDKTEVIIAWIILCILNTYNLYTLFYDSLLQGKGLIKRSKQILIIGQTTYLVIASILIINGQGLISIVSAQAISIVIIRIISNKAFFTKDLKFKLSNAETKPRKGIINAIYPNAVKIGLAMLGSFIIERASIIVGSLYLSLDEIASYSITVQIISVMGSLAVIYTSTYLPKMAQLRVTNEIMAIKDIYIKGELVLLLTYIIGGISLILFGDWLLHLIGSQTSLISLNLMIIAIIVSILEKNHSLAGAVLVTKNEVPFFKASIFAALLTMILLILLFQMTKSGIWVMIAAPGLAQIFYQNWKWPYEVVKDLGIRLNDIRISLSKPLIIK